MLTAEFKLEDAQQVWREEGVEEGLARGLERGKKEMARNLLLNGMPLDVIARSAGLPPEEIRALLN